MKFNFAILFSAAIIATGCQQKTETASIVPASVPEQTQKIQEPAIKTPQAEKPENKPVKTGKTAPAATNYMAKAPPIAITKTTEQSLAEVSAYGREVTRTQVSKSRTRAQQAEEDMTKDIASEK